jgi:starch-binding outer membrane protein, SusD/RagB family
MLSKIFSVKQCFFRWYFILLFLFFFSCKKFVEIDPPKTQITTPTVYNDDATATAAIRGIYSKMSENVGMFTGNLSWYGGLAGDELINYSTSSDVIQFYSNSLSSTNSIIKGLWQEGYQYIYFCNSIL